MSVLLPPAIADAHYRALDARAAENSEQYDVAQLVPLLIDNVDESALPHLAQWFSILGVEGWAFVSTDAEKRALLKEAIQIHRSKGTPWAIEQGLTRAGFDVVRIEEGTHQYRVPVQQYIPAGQVLYDGTFQYNGAVSYGQGIMALSPILFDGAHTFNGEHLYGDSVNTGAGKSAIAWAMFRVVLRTGATDSFSATQSRTAVAVIEAFKNERSWLTDIQLERRLEETVMYTDALISLTANVRYADLVGTGILHDGAARYDGTHLYSAGIDDALLPMSGYLQLTDTAELTESITADTALERFDDSLTATDETTTTTTTTMDEQLTTTEQFSTAATLTVQDSPPSSDGVAGTITDTTTNTTTTIQFQ